VTARLHVRDVVEYSLSYPPEFAPINTGTIYNFMTNVHGLKFPFLDNQNLSIDNRYFSLHTEPEVNISYFCFIENKLDT
jgi:hypothetical protein